MAVNANTQETYDLTTALEDLSEAFTSLTPTDTPAIALMGERSADNSYFEWTETDLAAVDESNRVAEGEGSPGNDAPTNDVRKGNYTQLSDKVVEISSRSQAVKGAGNRQRMNRQVAFKMKELKRDMAKMLLNNVAASAGSSGTASQTAGLPAFLTSNVDRGATGANGTTSGTGEAGYPNAAATDGTQRAITETILKSVIADCWDAGAEPSVVLCGSSVKQTISTFTGNATRYKKAEDQKLNAAIDVYISDFGELQIVPNRFQRSRDVFVVDPAHIKIAWLQKLNSSNLAKTGHSDRKLLAAEYGLEVSSQKAHGIIADVS